MAQLVDLPVGVHYDMPEHRGFKVYAQCGAHQNWLEWLCAQQPIPRRCSGFAWLSGTIVRPVGPSDDFRASQIRIGPMHDADGKVCYGGMAAIRKTVYYRPGDKLMGPVDVSNLESDCEVGFHAFGKGENLF